MQSSIEATKQSAEAKAAEIQAALYAKVKEREFVPKCARQPMMHHAWTHKSIWHAWDKVNEELHKVCTTSLYWFARPSRVLTRDNRLRPTSKIRRLCKEP